MSQGKRVSAVQPLLLSMADVATRLGVCRQTVYSYVFCGGLRSIKVRGIRRVHPDSLESWLKERERRLG